MEELFDEDWDICYECQGYGDDYRLDEYGELVWSCETCPFYEFYYNEDD